MNDSKWLQEIELMNKMPLNQRVLQILVNLQQQDPTEAIADDEIHLVQLLKWGMLDAGIKIKWASPETLFDLLMKYENRLTPRQMMNELTISDQQPMITPEMLRGTPREVAANILEAWVNKKIGQGIILTTNE